MCIFELVKGVQPQQFASSQAEQLSTILEMVVPKAR